MGILKQKSVMCLPWMRSILVDKLPHNPTLWLLSTARYAVLCVLSRFGRVQLCATLWTVASQAPLFMGFSRQEYWSGLPCPSPEDLPDPAIEPASLTSPALAAASLPLESPKKLPLTCRTSQFCSFFLPCSPLYTCMSCSLSSLRSLLSVTSLL